MRRRKKRTKLNKRMAVLLVIVGVFMLAAVASYLSQLRSLEKKPAEEYFRVFDATVNYGVPRRNGTAWIIYGISFKLQAVGGDAHNVIVQSWAMAEPVELGDIPKDGFKTVTQTSAPPFGYLSEMNEDGKFPMLIRITSLEAEGKITIYL